MKNALKSLCLLALVGGEATCRPVSASESMPSEPGGVSRTIESGARLTGHLLRSHSRDVLLRPVGSLRNLLFYTTTAATGLVKDTALDAVLVPRLSGEIAPLASSPGMDLTQWERELDRLTGRHRTSGNVQFLVDGEAFFDRLTDEIESAESSIRFRTYIFDNDDVAIDIADRLKHRASEIPVEVLVDGVGTWGGALIDSPTLPENHRGPVSMASYLKADSDIEVGVIGNAWLMGDHTKTFIFDDRLAFLGGMNIGREYRHDWHDLMVELTGPVVADLSRDARRASAVRRWGDFAALKRMDRRVVSSLPTDVDVRLLYTRPHDAEIYRAQLAAIRRSRDYIYIENAYLADDQLLYELLKARGRGVDVRVILPNRPDSELINRSNTVALNLLTEEDREDNVVFPRLLGVQTRRSGEVDVGEVQPDDGERSDFVRLSELWAYRSSGEKGSLEIMCAGGAVAEVFSAFGEQIRRVLVRLGAPRRQVRGCSAVNVVEDLANQAGIGNVRNDPQLSAAERAECDVDFKDALQSLRPGQRCGGRIIAVAA